MKFYNTCWSQLVVVLIPSDFQTNKLLYSVKLEHNFEYFQTIIVNIILKIIAF